MGYGRIDNFASKEKITPDSFATYTAPTTIKTNQFAYKGDWNVMSEYANPQKGASLIFNFESKQVFLVMRTKGTPAKVKVYIDDELDSVITVDADKLYELINLSVAGRHTLRLEFEDSNAELFAFTFG